MEYGVVPKLDVYVNEQAQKIQKVQPSNDSSKVVEGKESSSFINNEILKAEETTKVSKVENSAKSNFIEYTLTNFNFGFNNNSNEFFVRAIRGESENQYPTDEMMRLKAYLLKSQHEVAEIS